MQKWCCWWWARPWWCLTLVFLYLLHKQLNCLPQLISFYVVPISLVYSPLWCAHIRRLWVGLWAPDLVKRIAWCMFPPLFLLPPGIIFQVCWRSISSISSDAWDAYSVGDNSTVFLCHRQWSRAMSLFLGVLFHCPWDIFLSLVVWPSLVHGYPWASVGVWPLLFMISQPDWSPGKVVQFL